MWFSYSEEKLLNKSISKTDAGNGPKVAIYSGTDSINICGHGVCIQLITNRREKHLESKREKRTDSVRLQATRHAIHHLRKSGLENKSTDCRKKKKKKKKKKKIRWLYIEDPIPHARHRADDPGKGAPGPGQKIVLSAISINFRHDPSHLFSSHLITSIYPSYFPKHPWQFSVFRASYSLWPFELILTGFNRGKRWLYVGLFWFWFLKKH